MIGDKRISVVIPCKNEEKGIKRTIKSVPAYVDEIIVVDNGSTDATATVASKAGAKVISETRTLNGIGYGYAHLTGLKFASGDYIFTLDGDDTYPATQIGSIVKKMERENIDFVSCKRLPLKNSNAISKIRQLGIWILNVEVYILYGRFIGDILSGMWGLKREIIPSLDLRMGDWNLSPEIKIAASVNRNIKFSEVHIDHFAREKEPSKQQIWKTGVSHALYILKRRILQDSSVVRGIKEIGARIHASRPVLAK